MNTKIKCESGRSGALFQLVDLKIAAVNEFPGNSFQVIVIKWFGYELNTPLLCEELVWYTVGSAE